MLSTDYAVALVQEYLHRLGIKDEPENPVFILEIMTEVAKDFIGKFAMSSYCEQTSDGSESYTLPSNVQNVDSVEVGGETITSKITEHEVPMIAGTTV